MPVGNLIQVRRGSSVQWSAQNPVLSSGELGFETDTNRLKIGNGIENWISLNYIGSSDNLVQVKNNNDYAISKGQGVYISGHDSTAGLPTIAPYVAAGSHSEQKFAGVASSYIAGGGIGYVIAFGVLSGIDTTGSISNIAMGNESWSNGDVLYVSPYDFGKFTKVKPINNIILVGLILYSHANGSILIRSFINPQFNELNGVNILNPINGNLLKYDGENPSWKNSSAIDGGVV